MIKHFIYTILIFFLFLTLPAVATDFKISEVKTDFNNNILLLNGNTKSTYVNYSAGFIENPLRAYIDLDDSILVENKKTIELKNSPIKKINMAQFQTNPNKVRLVFYSDDIDVLKNIKLIKNGHTLVFKLNNFQYKEDKIPIIFSDILPKEYEEDKKVDIDEAKFSKYILTNVNKTKTGLLISGVGNLKLSRPFILTDPIRIVFDMQNAISQKKEFYGEYELENKDIVKIGQFNNNTLRFVVQTSNPMDYKSFISPDFNSLYITDATKKDQGVLPNTAINANLKSVNIQQLNKNETVILLEFDKPVIHSLRRTYNKFLIDFLNVEYLYNSTILNCKQTIQFDGFIPRKMFPESDKLSLMFTVNDNLKVKTGMSQDGKHIYISLNDSIEEITSDITKPNEIIPSNTNDTIEKPNIQKEEVKKKLPLKNKVIVVDAGHGGKDVGAIFGKMYEKNPALNMAKMLQKNLENQGAKVIMTRSDDTYLTLKDRVSISNYVNPDLFVSIHLNSSEKSHINGIETHWYKEDSKKLAEYVQTALIKNVNATDRGLFKSMFYVINHTEAPAILVETGFISNQSERDELFDKTRQQKTADGISEGIINYIQGKK